MKPYLPPLLLTLTLALFGCASSSRPAVLPDSRSATVEPAGSELASAPGREAQPESLSVAADARSSLPSRLGPFARIGAGVRRADLEPAPFDPGL